MVILRLRPASFEEDGLRLPVMASKPRGSSSARWIDSVVDTGARATVLRSDVVAALGLEVVGTHEAVTLAGSKIVPPVEVTIHIPDGPSFDLRALVGLEGRDFECLLGRDVLGAVELVLDGPGRHMTIAF